MKDLTKYVAIALAMAIGSILAPLSPRGAVGANAAMRVTLGSSAHGGVLYRADWSRGLAGWSLYRGFGVAHGLLTFDGNSDSGAYAPFRLTGITNFAVEATIKVGTPAGTVRASYDIFVRRASARTVTGLFAGYESVAGEKAARSVASLYWQADRQPYYAPGAAFVPGAAFHLYRLEVRGSLYRLLIDGREMVPWTRVTLPNPGEMAGLVFTYLPARVKTFAVFALPAAQVTTTLDTDVLFGHIIRPLDVPFPADSAVFRDNNRYALDNSVNLATVRRTGRIYGYYQGFEDKTTYVEQSVNLHQSPSGAQAAFELFSRRIRHNASQFQGYREVDISAHKIGDESFAFTYQYLNQGLPSYVFKVLFHRGRYYVAITVDSTSSTVPPTAIIYAEMADKLVR